MGTAGGLQISAFDPLLHDVELPLCATYYPVGFPLRVVTNSRHVLESAVESWGMYPGAQFDTPPLQVRVIVQPEGERSSQPSFRVQGKLFSAIFDRDNFMVFDSNSMSGHCFLSAQTAASHPHLRMHYLEAMVYMLLAQRYVVPMHAACVARNGAGVLLCGRSTAGKSTLSYGCARAGWTYVADDCTWLLPHAEDRMAIGKSHMARFREDAPRLFPELEGYAVRARPNGKLGMEVPLSDFPQIRTTSACPIESVVLLDRRPAAAARIVRISGEEVVEQILHDMPSYGQDVSEMYARTAGRLLHVPAYRMQYETLEDGIRLLSETINW